tara:strand:- start:156 stop:353 length:198 start_codon:yes stop_codon:yes gene_type:complete
MNVGDLVKIIASDEPFHFRPGEGSVGMIVEIQKTNWLGVCYYVYINGVGWRYYEKEVELISDGSG